MTAEIQPGGVAAGEQAGALRQRAVVVGPAATAAHVEFARSLRDLTRHLPAAAVASWDSFPDEYDARVCVPPPVRIGTSLNEQIPIVVPTDGENQWRYGAHDLTVPVGPGKPSTVGRTVEQQALDKKEAMQAARETNREKLAGIVTERTTAIEVVKGIATRVFATVAPGAVSLDVCGPKDDTLLEFSDFGALRQSGLYRPSSPYGLHDLLVELDEEQALRSGTVLSRRYPTLRSHAEAARNVAPVPFRMIAIFGDGKPVDPKDLTLLEDLMRNAHRNGHMMFVHGIRFPDDLPWTWTDIAVNQGRVDIPDLSVRPRFDGGPPSELVEKVSAQVANARDAKGNASTLYVSVGHSGASYNAQVQGALDRVANAKRTDTYHARHYPWLNEEFLTQGLPRSVSDYLHLTRRVASGGPEALAAVRTMAHGEGVPKPDHIGQMIAWAALDLAESTLGHGEKWKLSLATENANGLISRYRNALASVVGVTKLHVPPEANTAALPYHVLHEEPPIWAFQLLADRAVHAHWTPTEGFTQRELEATCIDIELTYGLKEQLTDRATADCLAACRLLDLHGFAELDPELATGRLTMLARYVERSIGRLSPEQVEAIAPRALPVYAACQEYLDKIGRTVTVGDVLKGAAKSTGASIATGARALVTRRRNGTTADGTDATEPAEPPAEHRE